MNQKGIGTSVHYKPLHRMTYYMETYNLNPGDFPQTEKIWKGTVSLPIYPDLKEDELQYICKTIKNILKTNNNLRKIFIDTGSKAGKEISQE